MIKKNILNSINTEINKKNKINNGRKSKFIKLQFKYK